MEFLFKLPPQFLLVFLEIFIKLQTAVLWGGEAIFFPRAGENLESLLGDGTWEGVSLSWDTTSYHFTYISVSLKTEMLSKLHKQKLGITEGYRNSPSVGVGYWLLDRASGKPDSFCAFSSPWKSFFAFCPGGLRFPFLQRLSFPTLWVQTLTSSNPALWIGAGLRR